MQRWHGVQRKYRSRSPLQALRWTQGEPAKRTGEEKSGREPSTKTRRGKQSPARKNSNSCSAFSLEANRIHLEWRCSQDLNVMPVALRFAFARAKHSLHKRKVLFAWWMQI